MLRRFLSFEGTLFVHIDDNELGYLIVLLDELFGRDNRLYVVTFKQGSATGHKAINPGCVNTTNFLVIYAKDKAHWTPNRIFTARERDDRYSQFIENVDDHFTAWRITTKIPNHVLTRCEWGHDDYSLRVENLPKAPPEPGQQSLFGEEEK